jgi:hypothetical protein
MSCSHCGRDGDVLHCTRRYWNRNRGVTDTRRVFRAILLVTMASLALWYMSTYGLTSHRVSGVILERQKGH